MKKIYLSFFVLIFLTGIVLVTSCKKDDDDDKQVSDTPIIHIPIYVYSTYYYANWSGISGASGYKLDVATDAGFTNYLPGYQAKNMGGILVAEIEGLTPNTPYFMRVKSINSNGESGYSGTREVITAGIDTLPNLNFERWVDYVNFSEPTPYRVWATANKTVDLNPGLFFPTTEKTADAHSGNYAAKMFSTDQYTGMPFITGNVTTGVFNVDLANPLESLITGVPYKSRPTKFKGWFKYFPGAKGPHGEIDSCEIRITMTKYNFALGQKDTIAHSYYRTTDTVDIYTEFNINVAYRSQELPDTIEVIFASSAAGSYFTGRPNSTLYIDDVTFEFN